MSNSRDDLLRQRLEELEKAEPLSRKKELEERLREDFKESHVVDEKNNSVIFLYKDKEESASNESDKVSLLSELGEYCSNFELKRIEGTNIYFLDLTPEKKPMPDDLRTEYIFYKNPDDIDETWENERYVLSMPKAPEQKHVPKSKESANEQLEQMKKDGRFLKFTIPEGVQYEPYVHREF